mgnify:CR=1 FL=1|tara:strand:+ start:47 stop:439 length:393 start_codon:yes stop_codon:yes gene_type:complete
MLSEEDRQLVINFKEIILEAINNFNTARVRNENIPHDDPRIIDLHNLSIKNYTLHEKCARYIYNLNLIKANEYLDKSTQHSIEMLNLVEEKHKDIMKDSDYLNLTTGLKKNLDILSWGVKFITNLVEGRL